MNQLLIWLTGTIAALAVAIWLVRRLRLSAAKHPSLRGHSRMARRLARLMPLSEFSYAGFFKADGAPEAVAERRAAGFEKLSDHFHQRSPESIAAIERLADGISDLKFIGRYRVPPAFSRVVREHLHGSILVNASKGTRITDIDGNEFIDLAGSYGVNVFGSDFYKQCIDQGWQRVRALGPVLGPYHPLIEGNVERLRKISGLAEVSFHMSGTEAVMQAVRLARYHTGRSHIVRFCGAYHGWWDDVQPGIGNPVTPGKVYTLAEMSNAALSVLRTRGNIACVLVNPLQAMHPNGNAPADAALVTGAREARFDRQAYTEWLGRLRQVCSEAGIVLIMDEILVGFRIAARGAQEYFGVRADLVTYGKTVGGGLPVGVLCGRSELMKRFVESRPLDICFARGTFNSHPCVMAAMSAFLDRLESPELVRVYDGLDARWDERAQRLNQALKNAGLPMQVVNLSSVFTVRYTKPGRYAWMFQFYLNAAGLLLPWVGTGRLIFSIDFPEAEYDEVVARFVEAGLRMKDDGWWWNDGSISHRSIKRRVLRETFAARLGRPAA